MSELIDRRAAIDAFEDTTFTKNEIRRRLSDLPPVQPELTDEQAITHLQSSGWMQRHDKEMYESGLREQLADDSDSYDSLLPPAQPEPQWIPVSEGLPKKDGRYQVTRHDYVTNTEFIDILWYEKNTWWDRQATGNYAVLAWMTLPKIYKPNNK